MSGAQDGDANAGWISFGTAPDNGAEFPPSGAQGRILVTWKGGNKLQKAKAAGKGGAKITMQGTKVAEFTIKMSWPDRDPDADAWEGALALISPYGANSEKAWDISHRYAVLYAAVAAIVEEFDGPNPKHGTDEMEATVKGSVWTKPDNSGVGTGATPATPAPYAPVALPPLFAQRGASGEPVLPSSPGVNPKS